MANGQTVSGTVFNAPASGGPVAAIMGLQQQNQDQMQKLLKIIEQLQQENAEAVRQAAQAGGSAATQVANQIGAGLQRIGEEQRRGAERAEDREFAEHMQRLNVDLQKEAKREATAIGEAINSQRQTMMNYRDQFHSKKADIEEAIAAYAARTDEMLAAGWFSSPKGRKELAKRNHLISMMTAYADDQFDDRHLNAAFELHNDNIQRIIQGEEPMDLATLQVDPLKLPMASVSKTGKRVAPPDSIPPEKMFEMKLYGGYPSKGVVFNDEDNFGMPEGYEPRLADPETLLEALERDDYMRFATDQSIRQEMERQNQQVIVEALDKLQPLKDQYESFNSIFNSMAPNAVEASLERFLAEENPHKFNDVGRTVTSLAIQEMFGGGSQGEQMAVLANEMFDGKKEFATAEEAMIAMALESAVFNIKQHMTTEFMNAGDENGSLATQLVNQMIQELGEEQAALALGVPNTGVGLVKAQDVMQQKLAESISFANRMHDGLWRNSALEQFRKDLRKYTRLSDLYSMKVLSDGENRQQRVIELMNQGDALAQTSEIVANQSPEDVAAGRDTEAAKVQADLSLLGAMVMLGEEIGPDTVREVAALATGGLEVPETPNLQAYIDQTRVESERSGYAKAAATRASFNQRRQERAKMAARETPSVEESFEKGGAPQVVVEQVPALISLAGQKVGFAAERTGAGLVQMVAGKERATDFVRGLRTLQGRTPNRERKEEDLGSNMFGGGSMKKEDRDKLFRGF